MLINELGVLLRKLGSCLTNNDDIQNDGLLCTLVFKKTDLFMPSA